VSTFLANVLFCANPKLGNAISTHGYFSRNSHYLDIIERSKGFQVPGRCLLELLWHSINEEVMERHCRGVEALGCVRGKL
jgi:hypothetical protein